MKSVYMLWPWKVNRYEPSPAVRLWLPRHEYVFFASHKSIPGFVWYAVKFHAIRLASRIGIRRKGDLDVDEAARRLCEKLGRK